MAAGTFFINKKPSKLQLSQRIEIAFWDLAIYVMTESRFVQHAVRITSNLITNKQIHLIAFMLLIISASGFFSGFLLFSIISR